MWIRSLLERQVDFPKTLWRKPLHEPPIQNAALDRRATVTQPRKENLKVLGGCATVALLSSTPCWIEEPERATHREMKPRARIQRPRKKSIFKSQQNPNEVQMGSLIQIQIFRHTQSFKTQNRKRFHKRFFFNPKSTKNRSNISSPPKKRKTKFGCKNRKGAPFRILLRQQKSQMVV